MQEILDIIDEYVEAIDRADYETVAKLHHSDDPRFSAIEDFIPEPFGKETFDEIILWIKENAEPGYLNLSYEKTKVHKLAEDVCYSTSVVRQRSNGHEGFGRATLIFIKKDGRWGILHGHWSNMPEMHE
ncbi:MAG: YybH family protein [Candidatus Zixiibacteriota bacterium]